MRHEGPLHLVTLDGRVARASKALERDQARLATKEGREEARLREPLDGLRDVAGQSTFNALRELSLGPIQIPHRDALLRWVHELLQARVGWELSVDEADAVHKVDPALARRLARAEHAQGELASFDEARRALLDAPTAADASITQVRGWSTRITRLADLAPPVAAVRKELRSRRFEASRRLGLEHPWALATSKSAADLEALARALLDATEPLARELYKDARRRAGEGAVGPARSILDAFAPDAREGWPARLVPRWFEDVFRAIAPRPPRIALPGAIGGASFLRAAAEWGAALRLGSVARTLPFALARDPYPIESFVLGDALALAVAGRAFARRKLGLPARSADAHHRALARALLTEVRSIAGELVAGMRDVVRDDELEEMTARLFGAPLATPLAEAWSYGGFSGRRRVDAPARLVAAVRSHGFVRDLVDRFDEDWFDNPRAGAHLASIGAGPVWHGEVPEVDVTPAIARAFEEALG
jgi:hypothetical protein